MYHANVNVSLIVKNVTWMKSEITTSVGISMKMQKKIVYRKKVIFGILQYVVAKMVNMQEVLMIQ